jgi:hypothetical protein
MTLAPLRPLAVPALAVALAMAATTVLIAVAASSFGWIPPDSSSDELRRSLVTVLVIAAFNLFQGGGLIVGSVIAAAQTARFSRVIWRTIIWVCVVFLPLKAALIVGAVGATDLGWLAHASIWWVLEYLALALGAVVAAATLRQANPLDAVPYIRVGGVVVVVILLVAAVLETYLS